MFVPPQLSIHTHAHPLHLCFFLPHYLDLVASCLPESHCIPHFVPADITLQQTLTAPIIAKQVDQNSNVCATPAICMHTHCAHPLPSASSSDPIHLCLFLPHYLNLVVSHHRSCCQPLSPLLCFPFSHYISLLDVLTRLLHKYPPQPSQMPVNEMFLSFLSVCSPHLLTDLKYSHW
jgi:hypothetical protein